MIDALLVALNLIATKPADMPEAVECKTTTEAMPILRSLQQRLHASPKFIEPDQAGNFLRVLNDAEPKSSVLAHDGVLVLVAPQGMSISFVLDGEQVCGPFVLSPTLTQEALEGSI